MFSVFRTALAAFVAVHPVLLYKAKACFSLMASDLGSVVASDAFTPRRRTRKACFR